MAMIARSLILASALLAASASVAVAQSRLEQADIIAAPALRANVQVSSDIVRIGDLIDNAGSAAQIAIYRAPDLGTTGSLSVPQVINTLRAHQVIGVDTRDLKEISVTRLARSIGGKDIEAQVGRALERKNGLGDAATRDRAVGMQARRQLRAGQAVKVADLAKPDLVQRDQNVTLIYESPGLYLTVRGKAIEGGTEGDVVNVMNLQSKRTVSGVVTGRGLVSVAVATPRLPAAAETSSLIEPNETAAPVSVAAGNNSPAAPTE